MAHFAELDENNIVVKVTVVDNNIETSSGKLGINNKHVDGETWCKNFFNQPDTTFKQTSYNNNFRKQYAGMDMVYNTSKNKFLNQQPFASWALDSDDDWQPPITYPSVIEGSNFIYDIEWNETKYNANNNTGWEATKSNDNAETPTVYNWNGSAWVSE